MTYFDMLLLGMILLFPVVDWINDKYKSKNKNVEYIKIAFFLWLPTLLLLYYFSQGDLSEVNFRIVIEYNWQNISVASLLFVAILYLFALIHSIQSSEELRAEISSKFEAYKDLLPVTKNEALIFTLVVSVSAGICEELLFRAYLYPLLESHVGMAAAIVFSSVVFGLWHIYLGWQEVIRTSITGAVLCGIYIFTGNIILTILVHIFIDVYSGLMCYFAMRQPVDKPLAQSGI